ncbi:GNAT family N-acetyltransferase [Pilimelia columellifera]|uniref:GNAT family N-acetyltransferase n=1 Tax=Pilimelia columellifera subsp. columellifera TaxID=706583 RepID=A0ABN3N6S7_9ACTN
MSELKIVVARYTDPDAQLLIRATLRDLGERYNSSGDETPVDPTEFDPPHGAFLVGYFGADPVSCAGWRSHGDNGLVAELKRMYTAPQARRKGLARRMLAAVEDSAREHGRRRLILETGSKQPESIAMYQACGYAAIDNFGFYKEYPGVRSFGRDLH